MSFVSINVGAGQKLTPSEKCMEGLEEVRQKLKILSQHEHLKLFTTYVRHPTDRSSHGRFEFRTGSKNLHLSFGMMNQELQWSLAVLLDSALTQYPDGVILRQSDYAACYVTKIAGSNASFHFSSHLAGH